MILLYIYLVTGMLLGLFCLKYLRNKEQGGTIVPNAEFVSLIFGLFWLPAVIIGSIIYIFK